MQIAFFLFGVLFLCWMWTTLIDLMAMHQHGIGIFCINKYTRKSHDLHESATLQGWEERGLSYLNIFTCSHGEKGNWVSHNAHHHCLTAQLRSLGASDSKNRRVFCSTHFICSFHTTPIPHRYTHTHPTCSKTKFSHQSFLLLAPEVTSLN